VAHQPLAALNFASISSLLMIATSSSFLRLEQRCLDLIGSFDYAPFCLSSQSKFIMKVDGLWVLLGWHCCSFFVALQSLILPKSPSHAGPVSIASGEPPSTSDILSAAHQWLPSVDFPVSPVGLVCKRGPEVIEIRAAREGGLGSGGVTPCTILKTLIGNRDQSNATSASAYSSRISEASAFAQAALDRSALRDLAWAFAEDVGPNLIGKLPVSAIVQMVAGKSGEGEARLGYG
jgi:hypothetical protein